MVLPLNTPKKLRFGIRLTTLTALVLMVTLTSSLKYLLFGYRVSSFVPLKTYKVPNGENVWRNLEISVDESKITFEENRGTLRVTTKPPVYENEAAIALIAMGKVVGNLEVERCIASIRRGGAWEGAIFLLTDEAGQAHYQSLTANDASLYLLPAPSTMRSDLPKKLMYLRFKTQFIDMIQAYLKDPPKGLRSHSLRELRKKLRTVVYVDTDVVMGKPMKPFLFYLDSIKREMIPHLIVQKRSERAAACPDSSPVTYKPTTEPLPYVMMFEEEGTGTEPIHGGVFVMDVVASKTCMTGWQEQIDSGNFKRDQKALAAMIQKEEKEEKEAMATCTQPVKTSRCHVVTLPTDPHFTFPSWSSMKRGEVATWIHITNAFRAKFIPAHVQQNFFQKTLGLPRSVSVVNHD